MTCVVKIASPLRSYTAGKASTPVAGNTLEAVLAELERRFPGMRFRMIDEHDRIRPHIRFFINTREALSLRDTVSSADEIHIICALSGG